MGRKKSHEPLHVLINGRLVGLLQKEPNGAIYFQYDETWLNWEHRFPVSLSLPPRSSAYRGGEVMAVFDNLLPDNPNIRTRVAERTGANGTDPYSLLYQIGRDCVGAMQFLPLSLDVTEDRNLRGEPIDAEAIEQMLANLKAVPLGLNLQQEFRISIAGAQEKTSLLQYNGQWLTPSGVTPTTHILKPEIGHVPTSTGIIDLASSVDNEHYCLTLLKCFGLDVAETQIMTFGSRRVLVVERFDRRWVNENRLIRLAQEDCCQALGLPSTHKYQATVIGHENGPSAVDILNLLKGSEERQKDMRDFFKSQIIFWLIGATDGHAKNFSIFLLPRGGYKLTPFYDVLSAQPAFDKKQIPHNGYKLAMSAGRNRKYKILDIFGRHFVETGLEGGLSQSQVDSVFKEIIEAAPTACEKALASMPDDFAKNIHESIARALQARMSRLIIA